MPAANLAFDLELPKDASPGSYRFIGMSGSEALGRLFEFHIRFSSDKPTIDPLKMLGEKVRLSMQTSDGQRHFHAYVTALEYRGPIELPLPAGAKAVEQYQYAIVARPWLWFLTRTSDCRVFQNLKVPAICDLIFGKYAGGVAKQLHGDYAAWEYCVQYRETDFNFVSRLAEQEGIFYFFEHGKTDHKLTLVDQLGPTTATKYKIPYAPGGRSGNLETECIYDWTMQHEVQPGAYVIKDYDFKKPSSPQLSVVKRPYEHTQGALEIFDYPGEFDSSGEGDHYVRTRLEELRTQYATMHGVCNVRKLAAGDVFEISNPEQAGAAAKVKYLVTEATFDLSSGIEFEGHGAHYSCSFSCIRAEEQFRSRRMTPKPTVMGPQTATVVGPAGEEIHVDEYGRIKVRFHWDRHSKDDKESSCWVRVSQPWAGKNFGMVAWPRIDQEVVVDFLEGDPDRPLVTGRVYNQANMPPYALPANKTQSGILTRSSLGASAANANWLRFEDKKGQEQVYLHAEKNQKIEVEVDEAHSVGADRTSTVGHDETSMVVHDQTNTVGNNQTNTVGGHRVLTVGKTEVETVGLGKALTIGLAYQVSVGAAMNETVVAAKATEVGAYRTEKVALYKKASVGQTYTMDVGGASVLTMKKDGDVDLAAKQVKLHTGKGSLLIKDDGTIELSGTEITLKTGAGTISIKNDGTIEVSGTDCTTKAGAGKVHIDAGGIIDVKGPMVKINT